MWPVPVRENPGAKAINQLSFPADMKKKAIIFDLDNTIYPVSAIATELFASLFRLLEESGELTKNLDEVKQNLMRRPFQLVAADFGFSENLAQKGTDLLANLRYEGPIAPFSDYAETRTLPVEKFLVTTGFLALQQSKVEGMGIEKDFREIHIVDLAKATKKEVFTDIMDRHGFQRAEVLVVGDDPESELKAAVELGIDAVLYDKINLHPGQTSFPRIIDFGDLRAFVL